MQKNDKFYDSNRFYHYIASISYDGIEYFGFQIQNKDKTVQEEIENVLLKLNQKAIKSLDPIEDKVKIKELTRIYFAGRTDSGVHAIENVISFSLSKEFKTEKVITIFNNNLPKNIRFYKCKRTEKKINPRFSAIERVYLYVIYTGKMLTPFIKNRAFCFDGKLNIDSFEQSLKIFEGKHNFKLFTTSLEKRNPIREVYETKVFNFNDFILVVIRGNSFLHKQVRVMLGSAFMCGLKKIELDTIAQMLDFEKIEKSHLDNKNIIKTPSIFVLPPEGLYLAKVIFEGEKEFKFEDILSFYKVLFS
jgi:tRNA pseudouridine38-40 synthase